MQVEDMVVSMARIPCAMRGKFGGLDRWALESLGLPW